MLTDATDPHARLDDALAQSSDDALRLAIANIQLARENDRLRAEVERLTAALDLEKSRAMHARMLARAPVPGSRAATEAVR